MIIKGQQIEIVQSYKYLGVYLDSKVKWKKNSEAVIKKAQSRLSAKSFFMFHFRALPQTLLSSL